MTQRHYQRFKAAIMARWRGKDVGPGAARDRRLAGAGYGTGAPRPASTGDHRVTTQVVAGARPIRRHTLGVHVLPSAVHHHADTGKPAPPAVSLARAGDRRLAPLRDHDVTGCAPD